MTAQIGEVLATYWRRAVSKPFVGCLVFIALIGILQLMTLPLRQMGAFIWTAMYGPGLVAIHFKQQIVQIRERRLPNCVFPHVSVVVGLLLLVGVGIPIVRMASSGPWSWGFPGLIFALTVLIFALISWRIGWSWILIIPLIYAGSTAAVRQWVGELCTGQHEQIGLALLAVGFLGITGILAWLLRLDEESAGYHLALDRGFTSLARQQPGTDDQQARVATWQSQWFAPLAPSTRQIELWPKWAQGSLWQRIKLWNVARSGGSQIWLGPAIFCMVYVGAVLMTPGSQVKAINNTNTELFMVFLPIFVAAGIWRQQREILAVELLRPVSRSRFLLETGLALAYRAAIAWLLLSIAWCVLAIALPQGSADWAEIVNVLVLSAAAQVLLFGIVTWLIRYGNFVGAWVVVMMAIIFGSRIVASFLQRETTLSPTVFLALSPVAVLLGILITYDAYRRWMQTELG